MCTADAVVRLLHLNAPQSALSQGADDDLYKVLVLDAYTKSVIAPLLRINDLRKHGITMHLMLENEREKIPDTPAVYFVRATEEAVRRIVADAAGALYDSLHLNFTPHLPKPLMEQLATGEVQCCCARDTPAALPPGHAPCLACLLGSEVHMALPELSGLPPQNQSSPQCAGQALHAFVCTAQRAGLITAPCVVTGAVSL